MRLGSNDRIAGAQVATMGVKRPAERDRAASRARLNELRGKLPFISHRALAAFLKIAATGELPECGSRKEIAAARDTAVFENTPFGPIHKVIKLPSSDGGTISLEIQSPQAMLYKCARSSKSFANLLRRTFEKHPPSPTKPWDILMYCDEVLPGNALSYNPQRKSWGVYWTIMQFEEAITDEDTRGPPPHIIITTAAAAALGITNKGSDRACRIKHGANCTLPYCSITLQCMA